MVYYFCNKTRRKIKKWSDKNGPNSQVLSNPQSVGKLINLSHNINTRTRFSRQNLHLTKKKYHYFFLLFLCSFL